MPYIDKTTAHELKLEGFKNLKTAGQLTYAIVYLTETFLAAQAFREVRYEHLATAIGAIENAKLEFYRRVVATYEEKKIAENGDVFIFGDSRERNTSKGRVTT